MKRMQESGMTLIELMVSMVISSLVVAGIYGVYTIQQRSYTVQEQVTEMQQRIRSAVDFISRDIRMAGYNPNDERACSENNKITKAEAREMVFNACNFDDGNDYKITIEFRKDEKELHLTRDEDMDGASSMPIAYGVDDFLFSYLDNKLDATSDLKKIRYVRIAMLVRSTYPDQKYTDTLEYTLGSGHTWGPADWKPGEEHYHRRLLITTIHVRNMVVL